MDMYSIKAVYFAGAGGIGMSALVRYFLFKGKQVAGYDRTPSELTEQLIKEGAAIHYTDDAGLIPEIFRSPAHTLVVYTPAVPESHTELAWFRARHFEVMKRSQVLETLPGLTADFGWPAHTGKLPPLRWRLICSNSLRSIAMPSWEVS